jgi:hypothetical protein
VKYKKLNTAYIAINYKINRFFKILIIINTVPVFTIHRQFFEKSANEKPVNEKSTNEKLTNEKLIKKKKIILFDYAQF